ncbi:MAG: hypothetical protein JSR66_23690 [Proteobacteria bacterium]|nr:hypothetical protein [Pseudomonadota bacterium]
MNKLGKFVCLFGVVAMTVLAVPSEARLTANRLTANRLTANRLTANRLTANSLAAGTVTGEGAFSDVIALDLPNGLVITR